MSMPAVPELTRNPELTRVLDLASRSLHAVPDPDAQLAYLGACRTRKKRAIILQ
jgi:hypothetical protein